MNITEVKKEDFKVEVSRVLLDSNMDPYKVVVSVNFINVSTLRDNIKYISELTSSLYPYVMSHLENCDKLNKYNIPLYNYSYFNSELELSNNRILYSFIIKNTQGYKDWLKGKDIIWYDESGVDRYDNV